MYKKIAKRMAAPAIVLSGLFGVSAGQVAASSVPTGNLMASYVEPTWGCEVKERFIDYFMFGGLNRLETHFGIQPNPDFYQKPSFEMMNSKDFACAFKAGAECVNLGTEVDVIELMKNPTRYIHTFTRAELIDLAISNQQACFEYARSHQIKADALGYR